MDHVCVLWSPEARTPMMPQSFVTSSIGTASVGETGITALGFTFTWATELRIVVMTSAAHALKLLDGQQGRHRPFFWALEGRLAGGWHFWGRLVSARNHHHHC